MSESDKPTTYAEAKMTVFWDVEDCPVPDGLTPGVIYHNIRRALLNLGHYGTITITAFANDTSVISQDDFDSAGIELELIPEGPKGKTHSRDMALQAGMLRLVVDRFASNMMVISEFFPDIYIREYSEYGHKIHLAQPRNGPKYQIIRNVDIIWFWESLAVGGKPIKNPATCPCCSVFKGDADADDALPEAEEHIC